MMQRRAVAHSSWNALSPSNTTLNKQQQQQTVLRPKGGSGSLPRAQGFFISSWILVLVACILTVMNFYYDGNPIAVQKVEEDIVEGVLEAEREMIEWWSTNAHQKPPLIDEVNTDEQLSESNQRMLNQRSKWVDGEKRLKQELKKLVALQKEGKELGVPVLTRWLGDDIPAWAGKDVDIDEWNAKVKVRYQEMRQEEERWIEMIKATVAAEQRG